MRLILVYTIGELSTGNADMRHLDLFSGIGGFTLAAREVWGAEHQIVGFCDDDPFCQQVLAKNFPNVPIYGDIRELTADRLAADAIGSRAGVEKQDTSRQTRKSPEALAPTMVRQGDRASDAKRTSSRHRNVRIDLLTGGFPCQPFSNAGLKKGDQDDRFLWPEMLRVIRETKPAWIVGENVAGIINMALDQVCADLERENYEVQPFVIPACAVGAPHRRDRVWIVARRIDQNAQRVGRGRRRDGHGEGQRKRMESEAQTPRCGGQYAPDAPKCGRRKRHPVAGRTGEGTCPPQERRRPAKCSRWSRDWREVALSTCVRGMDDGLSKRLVRLPDGTCISQARWRREVLKAYGNAIVPAVAVEIMKAIKISYENYESQDSS